MPRFDGYGNIELFLQRFNTLACYFRCSSEERLFRLRNSIQGNALYMLADLEESDNTELFNASLRSRFGTTAHTEQYRAELSQLRRGALS
jgi:hypothetical protein